MLHSTMDKPPVISVVLPVYNGERYLSDAVASILTQSESRFELLAIDDGSDDQTPAIIREFAVRDPRIVPVTLPRTGIVGALNEGIRLARGDFIARMDADDISLPDRFRLQLAYMQKHPKCAAVGTAIQRFGARDDVGVSPARYVYRRGRHGGISIVHPTAFSRTFVLRQIGGYRRAFEYAEDTDLWQRVIRVGEVHNLPSVLLRYRQHDAQASQGNSALQALRNGVAVSLGSAKRYVDVKDEPIDLGRALLLAVTHPERMVRAHLAVDLARQFLDRYDAPRDALRYVIKAAKLQPLALAGTRGRDLMLDLRKQSRHHRELLMIGALLADPSYPIRVLGRR